MYFEWFKYTGFFSKNENLWREKFPGESNNAVPKNNFVFKKHEPQARMFF